MLFKNSRIALVLGGILGLASSTSAYAQINNLIPPPKHSMVDPMGVDMGSGQVTLSIPTVSIGGELGLSHSIRPQTNGFKPNEPGFTSEIGGRIDVANITTWNWLTNDDSKHILPGESIPPSFQVIRVFSHLGQQDFKLHPKGELASRDFFPTIGGRLFQSGYDYVPFGDPRHRLIHTGGRTFTWVMPDGTESYYTNKGLERIKYPNGLIEKIYSNSVTNNTGFQLKLRYVEDKRPDNQSVKSLDADYLGGNPLRFNDSSRFWSQKNPRYVYAINNAYDQCDPNLNNAFETNSLNERCDLDFEWPKAEFIWPVNMPRALSLGENDFKVVDATGGVTTLGYKAFDVTSNKLGESPRDGYSRHTGRLVSVKPVDRDVPSVFYRYKNDNDRWQNSKRQSFGSGIVTYAEKSAGKVQISHYAVNHETLEWSANRSTGLHTPGNGSAAYFDSAAQRNLQPERGTLFFYMDHPGGGVSSSPNPNAVRLAETYILFEDSERNFPREVKVHGEPARSYDYDDRGNITRYYDAVTGGYSAGGYDNDCQNPKICNQPTWVKDAKDRITHYDYYPSTGQIKTVTLPADDNGIRPQTRYFYENKYAWYKKNSDAIERADSPISLLTKEAYCRTSAATANGCSEADDEVVTTYDYGPDDGTANNLFLRGVTIEADGEKRTTCYNYDRFGNKTSETMPKAGKTSCY